jgi:hypothetical protein
MPITSPACASAPDDGHDLVAVVGDSMESRRAPRVERVEARCWPPWLDHDQRPAARRQRVAESRAEALEDGGAAPGAIAPDAGSRRRTAG